MSVNKRTEGEGKNYMCSPNGVIKEFNGFLCLSATQQFNPSFSNKSLNKNTSKFKELYLLQYNMDIYFYCGI